MLPGMRTSQARRGEYPAAYGCVVLDARVAGAVGVVLVVWNERLTSDNALWAGLAESFSLEKLPARQNVAG